MYICQYAGYSIKLLNEKFTQKKTKKYFSHQFPIIRQVGEQRFIPNVNFNDCEIFVDFSHCFSAGIFIGVEKTDHRFDQINCNTD